MRWRCLLAYSKSKKLYHSVRTFFKRKDYRDSICPFFHFFAGIKIKQVERDFRLCLSQSPLLTLKQRFNIEHSLA